MKNNLDQFARIIPEEHTAIITPEAFPAILDDFTNKEEWANIRNWIKAEPAGRFYKGEYAEVLRDLKAGTLINPPKAVNDIADKLSTVLNIANTARRRRRIDGDEGEINIRRYLDDRESRLFTRRRRMPQPAPVVNICASIAFNCRQKPARYQEAAAALCAVSMAMEEAGFSSNIYTLSTIHDPKNGSEAGAFYQIKQAGTALNVSQVWTYSRPEVSRRINHCLMCAYGDFFGMRHMFNLGIPFNVTTAAARRITGDNVNIIIPTNIIEDTADDPAALASALQRLIDEATTTTPQED